MSREEVVVGLDIGTTKTCCLIAEASPQGALEVVGVGIVPTRGIKKGVVVNTEDVVETINSARQKAEVQSGFQLQSAYVGISGQHVSTQTSQGVVAVRHPDRQITEEDWQRAIDAARVVNVPAEREVFNVIPRNFRVDDQDGIKNPIGMLGHRIEVETTIVSGAMTSVNNIARCVERAGIEIDSLVYNGLAAGEAVLTEAERDLGVALVDLGGGTTSIAVFADGALAYGSVLPVGGFQVSNDIAVVLRTPFAAAEEIKIRHGYAIPETLEDDRIIDVSSFETGEAKPVSRREVAEIVAARMEETFELVAEQLHRSGAGNLPAGIVLCGGTAQLAGLRRLAADVLRAPVRIGAPSNLYGLTDAISTPAFAASVGLLKWGLDQGVEPAAGPNGPVWTRLGSSISGWLRNFFP